MIKFQCRCARRIHVYSWRKVLLAVQSVVAPPTTSVTDVTPVGDIKVTFPVRHPALTKCNLPSGTLPFTLVNSRISIYNTKPIAT